MAQAAEPADLVMSRIDARIKDLSMQYEWTVKSLQRRTRRGVEEGEDRQSILFSNAGLECRTARVC